MKVKSYLVVFFLAYFSVCFAHQDDQWSGEEYHNNSFSQKVAAENLLKQIPFYGYEDILDVGCGDGKITADLASNYTVGRVVGVDKSPSMLQFATTFFPKDRYQNLHFFLMDAQDLQFREEFDIAFSFTALHWVQDHQAVIDGIWNSLRFNGIYAVSMPMGISEALLKAVNELMMSPRWSCYFQGFDSGFHFVTPEKYGAMLQKGGFNLLHIKAMPQRSSFPSKELFIGFVSQWFPYLKPVPVDEKDPFMEAVMSRYFELVPVDENGHVHFDILRLEAIAEK